MVLLQQNFGLLLHSTGQSMARITDSVCYNKWEKKRDQRVSLHWACYLYIWLIRLMDYFFARLPHEKLIHLVTIDIKHLFCPLWKLKELLFLSPAQCKMGKLKDLFLCSLLSAYWRNSCRTINNIVIKVRSSFTSQFSFSLLFHYQEA